MTVLPALMTKAGIASNTTFEETTLLMTILRKTLFLKFSAILSTGSGIQRGVEQVTSLVPHRPDLGVQVSLLVLQEVPGLIDEGAVGSPGLSVHSVLHFLPAPNVKLSGASLFLEIKVEVVIGVEKSEKLGYRPRE